MHSGISTYCDQLLTTKDKHRDRHLDKRYQLKGSKIRVEYHERQSVKREKKGRSLRMKTKEWQGGEQKNKRKKKMESKILIKYQGEGRQREG